ncbi:alpha/beta hydrolase [Pendulispora brunnea]|uniref:Alpha/beta hydrolase n=1 Tax=Pendulispora brunnea TaxID=2905690 RepID=A0ABZ2K2Q0_9BACT
MSQSLHLVSAGSGEPVLLLHSGGMSSRQWRRTIDALSPSFRVIAPDFLGCGENPLWPEDEPFHFKYDIQAVERLIADLAGPVHLVGHSYGGFIALHVARRTPARIRSIAVYDPVAFGVLYEPEDAEALEGFRRIEENPALSDPAKGGGPEWMQAFIEFWNGPGSWKTLPAATQNAFLRVGKKVYGEVFTQMRDRTPAASYSTVTAPALLLHGEISPLASRRVVERIGAAMPKATVRTVAGAGHMGPITHSGVVNDWVFRHIQASAQS